MIMTNAQKYPKLFVKKQWVDNDEEGKCRLICFESLESYMNYERPVYKTDAFWAETNCDLELREWLNCPSD